MNINVKQLTESLKRLPLPTEPGEVFRVMLKERFSDHVSYDISADTAVASPVLNLIAVRIVDPYGHQHLEWELQCP